MFKINSANTKDLIVKDFDRIREGDYIDKECHYNNRRFNASLKKLLAEKDPSNLSSEILGEIIDAFKV